MNGIINWYLNMNMDDQGVVTLIIIVAMFALLGVVTKLVQVYPGYRKYVAAEKLAAANKKKQREYAAKRASELKEAFAAYAEEANRAARLSDIVRQTSNL